MVMSLPCNPILRRTCCHTARFTGEIKAPNVREQLLARDGNVRVAHEKDEYVKLLRCQRHGHAVFQRRVLFNVHLNIAVAQVHFAFARAAEHHFNARQKLYGLKRLYNVILCAAAQTLSEVKAAMKIDYFDDAELIRAQKEKYSGQE